MDYSPWGKNIELALMQLEVYVKCIHTKFGEHGLSGIRDFAPFQI